MQFSGRKDATLLFAFMSAWFVINCVQAFCVGVDGDEAYYWVLSRHLDWGYFDHPPFVALLMRAGESIGHGPFFTRLGTVILFTLSIGIIYKSLPEDLKNSRYYLLVFSGTIILNVYSFIATPDAPLFFFASLYFLGYKKYLEKQDTASVVLLTLSITGMLYSKYHGILPVFFTVLSNPGLLRKKTFWLIAGLVTIALLPHILWQWKHDWPTIRFHLFERNNTNYEIEFTTNYILGQILVWGPFTFILFFRNILKVKTNDKFIRAHLFTFYGVLLLFFISSFKSSVEPHWTLVSGISFVTLFVHILLHAKEKYRQIFKKIFIANIVLIILARVLFLIPHSPFGLVKNYKPFFYGREWADSVIRQTGSRPVIFLNTYIFPSLYMYYHPEVAALGYNEKSYRKTQYSLTERDCALDGQPAWIYNMDLPVDSANTLPTKFKPANLKPLDAFTCVNSIKIKAITSFHTLEPGKTITIDLLLRNEGPSPVVNRNSLAIDYAFFREKGEFIRSVNSISIEDSILSPGYAKKIQVPVIIPDTKGKYRLLFSIVNPPFTGNFASDFYKVEIK